MLKWRFISVRRSSKVTLQARPRLLSSCFVELVLEPADTLFVCYDTLCP